MRQVPFNALGLVRALQAAATGGHIPKELLKDLLLACEEGAMGLALSVADEPEYAPTRREAERRAGWLQALGDRLDEAFCGHCGELLPPGGTHDDLPDGPSSCSPLRVNPPA